MRSIFIHHPLFRLLFPPLYGLLVYVLVLLVFDSIQGLEENFFSQEALLCIGLTYALQEGLRLVLIGANRLFPEFKSVRRRLFIYLTANLTCSLIVISVGVSVYFTKVLGYPEFTTELLTLNSLYLVTTVLYTLVYFGIFYLNHYNRQRLEQETHLREKMEYQLTALKADVNPQLLYNSLETLIRLVHRGPEEADTYIDCLSRVYRYALEYRSQELAGLELELKAAENLVSLYNYAHDGQIHLHLQVEAVPGTAHLVPGTMQQLVEHAITRSMISDYQPLHLFLEARATGNVSLQYRLHEHLVVPRPTGELLTGLRQAYSYFTDEKVLYSENNGQVNLQIPYLQLKKPTVAEAHPDLVRQALI